MERAARYRWVARLWHFVERRETEHCDFCASVIPAQHSHLFERATRRLLCACTGCALSLGESAQFHVVMPRAELLPGFALGDAEWTALQIPIGMAFLFRSSAAELPLAIYPGPAGAIEAMLDAEAWSRLCRANPVLAEFEPDTEALLVNRVNGAREYYRVSIDRCYSLVGVIRTRWRGLSGGSEAWDAIEAFFAALRGGGREFAHG